MRHAGESVRGVFESDGRGGGWVRSPAQNYRPSPSDPVIPAAVVRSLSLRGGEDLELSLPRETNGRRAGLSAGSILTINGLAADAAVDRATFDSLTAIDPNRQVRFATPNGPMSMRVVDLMTPIGFGQRGLIVAPPRTGKTVLLQQMAAGLAANHPDVYMMVLLIDERPEEVTEMRRTVRGEVVSSSNDHDIASHVRIARLMIEKARRMVECRCDVFVLLDSLTRLGRAFNAAIRGAGRTLSGGLDIRALTEPKAMFGAARNAEEGGSLTIIASALIDTGSRMDEVIFNEFKGTGNMEIVLSRELANRRVWPAIDLNQSGTRKEERILSPALLAASHKMRRALISRGEVRAMETLVEQLASFPNNEEFARQAAGVTIRPASLPGRDED